MLFRSPAADELGKLKDVTLNAIIMQSAALTQLEMQENMNVLSHEQAKIDRAKITNVVLTLIDSHCV